MRTFFTQPSGDRRHRWTRLHALLRSPWQTPRERVRAARTHGEDGFLLIEVMISVLLVGLIVVATFNGFESANRIAADQRHRSEAELLLAESQEQLRSDSASALDVLESHPHTYTREITSTNGGKEIYTITQEAKAVSANNKTGCTVGTNNKENGANIEIISTATWPQRVAANLEPLREASLITPPVGSDLEVDVTDGGSTPEPGVTAIAKFKPVGSSSETTVEGTTGAAGCVVLSGLAATSAKVEIAEKPGWVTTGGKPKYPTKEVVIAPNITTQYAVTYAPGGALRAQFTYKGATTYSGKTVTGDTFVAFNTKIPAGDPPFEVGSTSLECAASEETPYKALAGTYTLETAETARCSKYTFGDLFPFPTSEWVLYAGDCPKNDTGPEAEGKSFVGPEHTTRVAVPTSFVLLNVMSGNWANRSTAVHETTAYEAVTYNPECEGYELPDNAFAATLKHVQKTNSEGLQSPFQPFGKEALCLYVPTGGGKGRTYRTSFTNATASGNTKTVYVGQASKQDREKEEAAVKAPREKEETEAVKAKEKRATEEAAAKTAKEKRATEETEAKTAKEKREKEKSEMIAARTAREKEEKEKRELWKKQEEKKEITSTQRKTKEKEQEEKRKTKETEEAAKETKWANEETTATEAKKARETAEAKASEEKASREAAEKEAVKTQEARQKVEKEYVEGKAAREAPEKEFEKETGFTAASEQTSC